MNLISATAFAKAMGVSVRAAQVAFSNAAKGKKWKGTTLPVVMLPGQRGGTAGAGWWLAPDRCAPELRVKLAPALEPAFEGPLNRSFKARIGEWQFEEQAGRFSIIRPALDAPKGSSRRAALLKEAAGRVHPWLGGARAFSLATLRGWVADYDRQGLVGLLPTPRSDKGKARVRVTREWDSGVDLPLDRQEAVAARVVEIAGSMIANDGTSIREVIRLSEAHLMRLTVDAGTQLSPSRVKSLCRLNTKWAARNDLERFRLVYMGNKDHKAWQDTAVPRIRRDLHTRPMGLLIGDQHYVDLLVQEGGETIRVRLIAWIDASSLFAWATPVFLSPGNGVQQEDVAEALAQLAMCPHSGIPEEYYLDNGSEYSALADAMMRLSVFSGRDFSVTLAKPYSPTSKGEIEGFFNILEGIFKGLPGWIGGDRTNKKSANKGQVIAPYTRGLEQLEADIHAAVTIYNTRPQSGRLGGLSPKEMLAAKIAETGFVARMPGQEAFDLIFSREETRIVRQGMISVNGRTYCGPEMAALLPGEKVQAFIPLRKSSDYIFVQLGSAEPFRVDPLPIFAHGDRDGARLQGELEAAKNRAVRTLAKQVDPTVSTFECQKAAADWSAPDAPTPEIWTRGIDKTAARSKATGVDEDGLESLIAQYRKGGTLIREEHMSNLDRATAGGR
jgi:hypothetical protein